MDEVEVTRNGRTNQFSITMVRGSDTIRCMLSVASGGMTDERSDGENIGPPFPRQRPSPRLSI